MVSTSAPRSQRRRVLPPLTAHGRGGIAQGGAHDAVVLRRLRGTDASPGPDGPPRTSHVRGSHVLCVLPPISVTFRRPAALCRPQPSTAIADVSGFSKTSSTLLDRTYVCCGDDRGSLSKSMPTRVAAHVEPCVAAETTVGPTRRVPHAIARAASGVVATAVSVDATSMSTVVAAAVTATCHAVVATRCPATPATINIHQEMRDILHSDLW